MPKEKERERVNYSFNKKFIEDLKKYCEKNKHYNVSRFIEDVVSDFIYKKNKK